MPRIVKIRSKWFALSDDPLNGRVHVRHLKGAEVQDIMDQVNDRKVIDRGNTVNGERQIEIELRTNTTLAATLIAVACVLDWENFFDENDLPLDCTPENVKLFAREDGFAAFLKTCREVLAQEAVEAEGEARKNSKALAPGSQA